jgi:hypothetical protein
MAYTVTPKTGRVTVGPPGGPTCTIPAGFTITTKGDSPYDLRLELAWNEREGRLTLREATFTATGEHEPVRMSWIMRIAIAEVIERVLQAHVLGEAGWPGVVAAHPEADQEHIDALVYLLSVALGGQRPSATVALARGLSPASGPKRVSIARQAGLIPATEPGKPSAGMGVFDRSVRAVTAGATPAGRGRRRRR